MSLHRTKATFIGLLEYGRANEWVVTEKLGDSVNNNNKNKSGDAAKKNNAIKATPKKTRSNRTEGEWTCQSSTHLFRSKLMD